MPNLAYTCMRVFITSNGKQTVVAEKEAIELAIERALAEIGLLFKAYSFYKEASLLTEDSFLLVYVISPFLLSNPIKKLKF